MKEGKTKTLSLCVCYSCMCVTDRDTRTFQHVHKQLDTLLVADQRLLETAAVVQLHCSLQDRDGGCLHP